MSSTTLTHAAVAERYLPIRRFSETLCETLEPEDATVQSMADASPTKWHLAHTTWFFETFLLAPLPGCEPYDSAFAILFNSYYNSVGEQFPRPRRGLLSRPTLGEVLEYRRHVDEAMQRRNESDGWSQDQRRVLEIGLHHEQQHQELILTDIKHALAQNPLRPEFRRGRFAAAEASSTEWVSFSGGVYEVGHEGRGFAYDNESPRHRVLLEDFQLADRLVTCGDFQEFIEDGGYRTPQLWLSEGWATVLQEGWRAPLYWTHEDGRWTHFTLAGQQPVERDAPLCHVSYFEADAFARWAGARLPTESEWEAALSRQPVEGDFADSLLEKGLAIHPHTPAPSVAHAARSVLNGYGAVWQWTASPYVAYPGYRPPDGALGEYNGKFMCNQWVLRGGSCASPSGHVRATYRNFFPASARWQFSGVRLARDA